MKKFDWSKPVTRKDYAVLAILSLGAYGMYMGIIYWNRIKSWARGSIEKIRKIQR